MYKKIGDTVRYEGELYKIVDTRSERVRSLGLRIGGGSSRIKTTLTIQQINNPNNILEVDSRNAHKI